MAVGINVYDNALPTINHGRTKMLIPDKHKLTFDLGDIKILECREVVPGDTFRVEESKVVRTQPLVAPVMDDIDLSTFHFFVPFRIIWENYKKFVGESSGKWYDTDISDLRIPQISSGAGGFEIGSTADDLGLPIGIPNIKVSALPFRAYASIINHFFRNTVTEDEIYVPLGDAEQTYIPKADYDYVNGPANGGTYIANRKPNDKFALATISPQRGPEVTINIGELGGPSPVYGNGKSVGLYDGLNVGGMHGYIDDEPRSIGVWNRHLGASLSHDPTSVLIGGCAGGIGVITKEKIASIEGATSDDTGLYADVNIQGASLISINELRNAFAIQRYYEALAMYGNRYKDIIKSLFGVDIGDARLSEPEFLGAQSVPVQIFQNVQSSSTDATTPQGNVVGYSVTGDSGYVFEKSFVERGFYMVLGVARIKHHTYQQGVQKQYLRKTFNDFYNPLFDNLGFDSILNAEIYMQGPTAINPDTNKPYDEEVFGYNERFIDYRSGVSYVSGEMRSDATTPLDMWHFADNYNALPVLTEEWQKEDKTLLDRCLAVKSSVSNQMFGDFQFNITAIRPMQAHSVPGAIR